MSYYVGVRIYCDEPDCQEVFEVGYRNKGGMNKTWASYLARTENGWYVPRGNDPLIAYCPTHYPERKKA